MSAETAAGTQASVAGVSASGVTSASGSKKNMKFYEDASSAFAAGASGKGGGARWPTIPGRIGRDMVLLRSQIFAYTQPGPETAVDTDVDTRGLKREAPRCTEGHREGQEELNDSEGLCRFVRDFKRLTRPYPNVQVLPRPPQGAPLRGFLDFGGRAWVHRGSSGLREWAMDGVCASPDSRPLRFVLGRPLRLVLLLRYPHPVSP